MGAFSTVYLAQDQTNDSVVALKIFHTSFTGLAREELGTLKQVSREDRAGAFGTLKYLTAFKHDRSHAVIVTEALVATDLFERPTTPTTDQLISTSGCCPSHIRQLVYDLTLTLFLFHEKLQRLHGDIKSENILFSKSTRRFKLIDFGGSIPFSRLADYYELFEAFSYLYRPPEILAGIPFTETADVWALGAVVFEACTKAPLSSALDPVERLTDFADILGPYPDATFATRKFHQDVQIPLASSFEDDRPEFWKHWRTSNLLSRLGIKDSCFASLLAGMLDPNQATRMTSRDILKHPFLEQLMPFGPPSITVSGVKTEDENEGLTVDKNIEKLVAEMTPIKVKSQNGSTKEPVATTTTGASRKRTRKTTV